MTALRECTRMNLDSSKKEVSEGITAKAVSIHEFESRGKTEHGVCSYMLRSHRCKDPESLAHPGSGKQVFDNKSSEERG